jgi:LuxR family maltose regulon positive regulatory protein
MHDRERRLLEESAGRTLSRRELDVARLLEGGMSRPRIATKLGLTLHTVASISKSVYRKLGVSSRAQLAKRMRVV